jgi:hypothetical protein
MLLSSFWILYLYTVSNLYHRLSCIYGHDGTRLYRWQCRFGLAWSVRDYMSTGGEDLSKNSVLLIQQHNADGPPKLFKEFRFQ